MADTWETRMGSALLRCSSEEAPSLRQAALLALVALALLLWDAGCAAEPTATATSSVQPLYVHVSFTTADGVSLSGRLYGEGAPGVVLAHMYPADQTSWVTFAERLASEEYAALTFDFRGYGKSGGEKELALIYQDVQAALGFLQARGVGQVFLVGASMGGTASLMVASQQEVAGVVTLSAPVSFMGLDASQAVGRVTAPKLFIAGTGDTSAAESLERLFREAPEPKERRLVESDAHGTNLLGIHQGEVERAILDFLSRAQETPWGGRRVTTFPWGLGRDTPPHWDAFQRPRGKERIGQ